MKTLRWIDRLALSDHGLLGHGNAGSANQAHFGAAEVAADAAPSGSAVLNISRDDNDDGQAGMHNDGVDEELPEALVLGSCALEGVHRIGDGMGHHYCVRARVVMGSVTMLMLLMPDWRSASTTAAKLPNGTVSSQRRKTPSCEFFNWAWILAPS